MFSVLAGPLRMTEHIRTLWVSVRNWMEGIVIFKGDVQTTSVAIAITASVLCSLCVLVASLLTEDRSKPRLNLLHVLKNAMRRKKTIPRARLETSKS